MKFNLGYWIVEIGDAKVPMIKVGFVKRAVQELKEVFERSKNKNKYMKEIDKIFGPKLTGEKG